MASVEPIELSRWREGEGLVRISYPRLMYQLALRGKSPAALKEARISYETVAKVKRGGLTRANTFRRLLVWLADQPVLEGAQELLS